ncbi:class I SAM-dependent methyltransferase [Psychroflexus aestuariivivens]|uniref:class I SAM-dependent methyltransferase n=1 Tax=Psychroflexus aestuariivivens TaxID=1795040 RepID=UPI000FD7DA61|nr:methyltransferase domain-containing protein [Psychroflexus aestuariivivens]
MNSSQNNPDIFGLAVDAYFNTKDETPIIVHAEDFYDDEIPVEYLFRNFDEMPEIEQEAINLARGKILDVGCCAGSHSLELQKRKFDVTAIDISEKSIEVCKKRGVQKALQQDFFDVNEKFDTILMLMNGIGIAGKIENLPHFFQHLKSLLKLNGQILLDSTDLIYLYDDEITNPNKYYGEIEYHISYKSKTSRVFDWLYIDYDLLKVKAYEAGFHCEKICTDGHFSFLAKLSLK